MAWTRREVHAFCVKFSRSVAASSKKVEPKRELTGSLRRPIQFFDRGGIDVDAAATCDARARRALLPIFALKEKAQVAKVLDVANGIAGATRDLQGGQPALWNRLRGEVVGRRWSGVRRFAIEQRDGVGRDARQCCRPRDAFAGRRGGAVARAVV